MPESTAKEYAEKRAKAIADSRSILEKARKEDRAWTADEEAASAKAREDARMYGEMMRTEMENDKEERALQELRDMPDPGKQAIKPEGEEQRSLIYNSRMSAEETEVLAAILEKRKFDGKEYDAEVRRYLRGQDPTARMKEVRTQQADLDQVGGYFLAPIQMVQQLLKNVDDLVAIRQKATKFLVNNSLSLGVPTLENDADDFDFTSELKTGSVQSDITFGKRELKPAAMAKRLLVSEKLIRAAVMDVTNFILGRLAVKAGGTEEKAFMTGNGVNGPLGLFTASNKGISTARDFSAGNTSSAVKFNGLKTAKWKLKPQYRAKAEWIFHSDVLLQLDKEVDSDGQYIWQPSVIIGKPDTLLGLPITESMFAPNTMTTGQYVGLLGDMSYYWIADALNMAIKVLSEVYAEQGQIAYLLRAEVDGMPVLEEAFSRVTLA